VSKALNSTVISESNSNSLDGSALREVVFKTLLSGIETDVTDKQGSGDAISATWGTASLEASLATCASWLST
jgi:hypothetical protein